MVRRWLCVLIAIASLRTIPVRLKVLGELDLMKKNFDLLKMEHFVWKQIIFTRMYV